MKRLAIFAACVALGGCHCRTIPDDGVFIRGLGFVHQADADNLEDAINADTRAGQKWKQVYSRVYVQDLSGRW